MPWFSNKKSKNMTSTENEKDTDTGVDQPQETQGEENLVSQQPEIHQNSVIPQQSKWKIKLISGAATAPQKIMLTWLQIGISPETEIRPVDSNGDWKPLKEWFPEECNKLFASTKRGEPAVSNSILPEVKALIEALQVEVQRLTGEMEYTKTFTTNQRTQIDQLYMENRQYKDDIIGKFKESLVKAIIEQLDFADNKVVSYKREELSQEDFAKSCCDFADDFREVLQNRLDINSFKPESGDDVDLKRHKVLRTLPTDDSVLHKKIAVAVRYGYENENGKIVRPAFIETYEYTPTVIAAEQQSESADAITQSRQLNAPKQPETASETTADQDKDKLADKNTSES